MSNATSSKAVNVGVDNHVLIGGERYRHSVSGDYICMACGALVIFPSIHSTWHRGATDDVPAQPPVAAERATARAREPWEFFDGD